MRKISKKLLLSDFFLLLCVCMLCYPITADIWNTGKSSRMYAAYQNRIEQLPEEEYDTLLTDAVSYNKTLIDKGDSRFLMSEEEERVYKDLLRSDDTDVMAYLTIGKLGIQYMPIYHTTGQEALQSGVGHYEGSSLPVGGMGTHCVLSGHTGMAGKRMFTDLGEMEKGDIFQIEVLDQVLTYQVDRISVVLPEDVSELAIDPEKDYCTLITCTPVGINSHRLLVRGVRVDNEDIEAEITTDNGQKETSWFRKIWKQWSTRFAVYELVMALAACMILVIFLIPDGIVLLKNYIRRRTQDEK